MGTCCICKNNYTEIPSDSKFLAYDCPSCGKMKYTDDFYKKVFDTLSLTEYQKANFRGWLAENQDYILDIKDIDFIQRIPTPTVESKADKLLLYLVSQFPRPGQVFQIEDSHTYLRATWSSSNVEFNFLRWTYLREKKGWVENRSLGTYIITPEGWSHINNLQAPNANSKTVFVAMRFNDNMKRLYNDAIKQAITDCGFDPIIMYEQNHNNTIDDEIVAQIRKSRFIIADFTEQNQGAYYEAGFARGLGLPIISTCNKEEVDAGKLHFDIRQYRTILWEENNLEAFRKELKDCIEANIGTNGSIPSPRNNS